MSQVLERLRSCEAAIELLGKYDSNITSTSNWMDELDNKLKNYEALEAARAKEAWEKHVVSGDRAALVFPYFLGSTFLVSLAAERPFWNG